MHQKHSVCSAITLSLSATFGAVPGDHHWKAVSTLYHHGWYRISALDGHMWLLSLLVATKRLSVVTQSSTAFIVLCEAAPTSFQPRTLIVTPLYVCTGAHACMLNKAHAWYFSSLWNNLCVRYISHYLCITIFILIAWVSNCWQLDWRDRSKDACKDPWHFRNTEHRSWKWNSAWYISRHNNRDITATSTNCPEMTLFVGSII